jgi:hypothetical protein
MRPYRGDRTLAAVEQRVGLVKERRFDLPRPAEVQDGARRPGSLRAWRLCDGNRVWMADVRSTPEHNWGPGRYDEAVPVDQVGAVDAPGAA